MAIIFFGCVSQKPPCCTDQESRSLLAVDSILLSSREIGIADINASLNEYGWFANSGFHFIHREDRDFLAFVASNHTDLIIQDIFNGEVTKVDMGKWLERKYRYNLLIQNDTIHIINADKFTYAAIQFDTGFRVQEIYRFDLKEYLSVSGYFLNSHVFIDKKIAFTYPYLVIPYGKTGRHNGMDDKLSLRFDVVRRSVKKMFKYPQKYYSCDIQDPYPILSGTSDGRVIAAYMKDNTLFELDVDHATSTTRDSVRFNSQYMCYDRSLADNLAYTNKFDLNDECNVNLITTNSAIILIKDLRRDRKTEPLRTAILVFKNDFKCIGTFFPGEHLDSRLIFPYKNGILAINSQRTKGYHYEIP